MIFRIFSLIIFLLISSHSFSQELRILDSKVFKEPKKVKTREFEWRSFSSPDGKYILTGSDKFNSIYFRDSSGKLIWKHEFADSIELESASISKNGKLIVIGAQRGFVTLFNKKGKELWRKLVKGEVQTAITSKGDRIFSMGSSGRTLFCYSKRGKLIFSKKINHRNWATWTISITPDANKILVGTNSDIIILNRNGTVLNHYDIALGNRLSKPTISPDGNYFAHFIHNPENLWEQWVVCRSIDNMILWKKRIHYADFRFDKYNNLYVASRMGGIKAFNVNGKLIGSIKSPEMIDIDVSEKGDILFGTTKGFLEIYSFDDD